MRFPGGGVIDAMNAPGDGDFERGLNVFRAMTPALAALAPVFALIQAVLAVKDFVDAFTSFPPDFVKLVAAIDKFSVSVQKLVAIAPPVSVPLLIKDLLTCMVSFLGGVVSLLLEVQRQQQRIDAARARGIDLNLPEIEDLMDCAQENITLYLQHIAFSMGSIATLWGVIQVLADAAGMGDLIPSLDFDVSGDLDSVIDKLSEIIMRLQEILGALP